MARSLPVCLLVCLIAGPTFADWPQFRGPAGDGHATDRNLPTQWGPEKNVAWKQEVPGAGWSSPVVVAGKVYLTTAVTSDEDKVLSLRALCLDAADGKVAWNVEVFRHDATRTPRIHGKNSHASPTPLVEAGRLYVHFGHQGTACLDLSGQVVWKNDSLRYAPVHGNGGSPLLIDGLLVFSTDGSDVREVVALDAGNGKIRWRSKRSGTPSRPFSFSTPQLIVVDGKKQIISPASDMVGAYDPVDGKEIWRVRYRGYSVIPRPVFAHGLVFVSTSYDAPEVIAIRADGRGDVTDTHIAWRLSKGAPHTPSMLVAGSELYLVSDKGLASCLDARSGKVHWQNRVGGTGYSASPIHAEGKLYLQSEDGVGTVLQAGTRFSQVARNPLNERSLASYAVADGALFIRTASKLYRIGQRSAAD